METIILDTVEPIKIGSKFATSRVDEELNVDPFLCLSNVTVVKVALIAIFSSLLLLTTLTMISSSSWLKTLADNAYATNAAQGFYSAVYSKNAIYYLSLLLGSAFIALFSYIANFKVVHLRLTLNEKWLSPFCATLVISLMFALSASDFKSWQYLYIQMFTSNLRMIYFTMIVLLFSTVFFQLQKKNQLFNRIYCWALIIFVLFIAFVFLRNYIDGFSDLNSNRLNNMWNNINFNAPFYSVVQANLGKMPLIDYFAQYGYYSYILRPIFLLIPLTLTSFVTIMAVLSILFFSFMYLALQQLITNRIIALLTTLVCISVVVVSGVADLYLANLPIRYIWPSIGFFLIVLYSQSKSKLLYYIIQLSCVLALIWNLDTGVVLTVATLLLFSYESVLEQKEGLFTSIVRHWIINFILIAGVFACYGLYTWYVRNEIPLYSELIRFQVLFFEKGIMASPINLFSPWVISCIVYLCAITFSINALFSKGSPEFYVKPKVVLFLALYGAGSFSYFIMRGHLNAFYAISWPSIILLGIFTSYLQDSAIIKKSRSCRLVYVCLLLFLTATSIGLLSRLAVPRMTPNNYLDISIENQRSWVKSLHLENNSILIISDLSGILHLDSKTSSPLRLPGSTETILRKDIKTIEDYLVSHDGGGPKLIVDTTMLLYNNEMYKTIRAQIERLHIIQKSPVGNLTYYSGFAD